MRRFVVNLKRRSTSLSFASLPIRQRTLTQSRSLLNTSQGRDSNTAKGNDATWESLGIDIESLQSMRHDDDKGIPDVQFREILDKLSLHDPNAEALIQDHVDKFSYRQLTQLNDLMGSFDDRKNEVPLSRTPRDIEEHDMHLDTNKVNASHLRELLEVEDDRLAADVLMQSDNFVQLKKQLNMDESTDLNDLLEESQASTQTQTQAQTTNKQDLTPEEEREMSNQEILDAIEDEHGTGIEFPDTWDRKQFIAEMLYREWIHRVAPTFTFVSHKSREQLYQLHKSDPNKYSINALAEKVGLSRERVAAIIHLKRMEKDHEKETGKPLDYQFDIKWDMYHNVFPDDPAPAWYDNDSGVLEDVPEYPNYGFGDAELPENEYIYRSVRRAQKMLFPEEAPPGYHSEPILLRDRTISVAEEAALRKKHGWNASNEGNQLWHMKGKKEHDFDKPLYVREPSGVIRTLSWSEYYSALAQNTRKNLFQLTEEGMRSHFVVPPRKYRPRPDSSWKDDEELN